MKIRIVASLVITLAFCTGPPAIAQTDSPDADHSNQTDAAVMEKELDEFRDGLFQAFNKAEYKPMLDKYCHQDIITMWQDGTVGNGHDGVIAEFDKLAEFISRMEVDPTSESRLILDDGQTVISTGKMRDTYDLKKRGTTVGLDSSYVATLKKQDGKWSLVSFSASTNAFDNEVVQLYDKLAMYKYGGIGIAIGLIVGIVAARLISGKRSRVPA